MAAPRGGASSWCPSTTKGVPEMIHLVVGATNPNCRELVATMFRQRYDIFVKEKGWKLKSYNGLEFDNYDTDKSVYLMSMEGSTMVASMRMTTTDGPYMLADIFADMCENGIPRDGETWELTRGALAKNLRKSGHWGRMQCALVEAALLFGIKRACGLFTVDHVMRQMRGGSDAKPLGQPRMIDGEANVAFEFPLNVEVLQRTRTVYRITEPAIQHIHLMPAQQRKAA
jgi:N-acyl-L-homoserine lactone synthetase